MPASSTWSPEKYREALNFAAEHHGAQKMPGTGFPYVTHITAVAAEVIAALRAAPGMHEHFAVQCALLHDVIEDTAVTFEMVRDHFGLQVAEGVLALTKDESLPKPAQMDDSLDRILLLSPEVAMVKLADRIVNLAPPPAFWPRGKRIAYRDQAARIALRLGAANDYLQARIHEKIEAYVRYIDEAPN